MRSYLTIDLAFYHLPHASLLFMRWWKKHPGPRSIWPPAKEDPWNVDQCGQPHLQFGGRLMGLGCFGFRLSMVWEGSIKDPIAGWFKKWKIPFRWMIWGYPYYRKPPYVQTQSALRQIDVLHNIVNSEWVSPGRYISFDVIPAPSWCHLLLQRCEASPLWTSPCASFSFSIFEAKHLSESSLSKVVCGAKDLQRHESLSPNGG